MMRFISKVAILATLGLAYLVNPAHTQEPLLTVSGYTQKEALELGEKMYRLGILPSGQTMEAIVQDDIPVDGSMFSCQSCHLRSGLGAVEGTIVTPPTNSEKLFKTLHRGAEIETKPARQFLPETFQGGDIRPKYDTETLKEAIWFGVDPNERELSKTMPRYSLDDTEMSLLVHYLKNLSSDFSPGITKQVITIATVVTDEVDPVRRENYLATLNAYIRDRNSQNRHEEKRAKRGPFYKQDRFSNYRRIALEVWDLKGPPETWRQQLAALYRSKPVFALVGGLSTRPWAPIHDFCEELHLPGLLPLTELPKIENDSWYTLYFSKGTYQEGETAAKHLRQLTEGTQAQVIQILRQTPEQLAAAKGFSSVWTTTGRPEPAREIITEGHPPLSRQFWLELVEKYPKALFTIWLTSEDLIDIGVLEAKKGPSQLVFSSRLIDRKYAVIPEGLRSNSLLTYPYRMPDNLKQREAIVSHWFKIRKIPITDIEMQTNAFFLGWMISGGLNMMGDDFYRDYLLDVIDMMPDEESAITNYKRLSFGPGQRFASKGCYIVQLTQGEHPALTPVTDWIVY